MTSSDLFGQILHTQITILILSIFWIDYSKITIIFNHLCHYQLHLNFVHQY